MLGQLKVPPHEVQAFGLLETQLTTLTQLLGGLPLGGTCYQATG